MFSDEIKLSDYPHAHAVSSVETGTLSASASLLIQSGFASRLAAIRAVEATSATFDSMAELESWLRSEELAALSKDVTWPTKESHQLWLDYLAGNGGLSSKAWTEKSYKSPVKWSGVPMPPGTPLRIGAGPGRENVVLRSDFEEVGTIPWVPNTGRKGIVVATATGAADSLALEYIGPDDLLKA
jgi:hypothetical protein